MESKRFEVPGSTKTATATGAKAPSIPSGKFNAKAFEGCFTKIGKNETSAVAIHFRFTDASGKAQDIWATRYLTGKERSDGKTVLQATMEDLARIGFNEELFYEHLDSGQLEDRDGAKIFDTRHLADKEVSITIEHKPSEDGKKIYAEVAWINELGGSRYKGVAVQEVLGGFDLRAQMREARANMGAPAPQAKPQVEDDLKDPETKPF